MSKKLECAWSRGVPGKQCSRGGGVTKRMAVPERLPTHLVLTTEAAVFQTAVESREFHINLGTTSQYPRNDRQTHPRRGTETSVQNLIPIYLLILPLDSCSPL